MDSVLHYKHRHTLTQNFVSLSGTFLMVKSLILFFYQPNFDLTVFFVNKKPFDLSNKIIRF